MKIKTDEQILDELTRAAEGLWYMSESDYPFEPVRLDDTQEPVPVHLREIAGAGAEAHVGTRALEEFLRNDAAIRISKEGGAEKAGPASFDGVIHTLKENLTDIRVYRIGEINIPVYILGRSPSGRWLGLQTRVVET